MRIKTHLENALCLCSIHVWTSLSLHGHQLVYMYYHDYTRVCLVGETNF